MQHKLGEIMKKIAIALIATFAALSVWAQPSLQMPAPVQAPSLLAWPSTSPAW
jgi:hypothetical protein